MDRKKAEDIKRKIRFVVEMLSRLNYLSITGSKTKKPTNTVERLEILLGATDEVFVNCLTDFLLVERNESEPEPPSTSESSKSAEKITGDQAETEFSSGSSGIQALAQHSATEKRSKKRGRKRKSKVAEPMENISDSQAALQNQETQCKQTSRKEDVKTKEDDMVAPETKKTQSSVSPQQKEQSNNDTRSVEKRRKKASSNAKSVSAFEAEYFCRVTRSRTGSVPDAPSRFESPPITPISRKKTKQFEPAEPKPEEETQIAYVVVSETPSIDGSEKKDTKSFRSPRPRKGQKILFESKDLGSEPKSLTGIRRVTIEPVVATSKDSTRPYNQEPFSSIDPKSIDHGSNLEAKEIGVQRDPEPVVKPNGTVVNSEIRLLLSELIERVAQSNQQLLSEKSSLGSENHEIIANNAKEDCFGPCEFSNIESKLVQKTNYSNILETSIPTKRSTGNTAESAESESSELEESVIADEKSEITNLPEKRFHLREDKRKDHLEVVDNLSSDLETPLPVKSAVSAEATAGGPKTDEHEGAYGESVLKQPNLDCSVAVITETKSNQMKSSRHGESSELENTDTDIETDPPQKIPKASPVLATPKKIQANSASMLNYMKMLECIRKKWLSSGTPEEKTFVCKRCKQRTSSRLRKRREEWMNEHILIHLPRACKAQLYGCRLCNFLAPEKFHFPMHLTRAHYMTSTVAMAGYQHYVVQNVSRFDTELTALAKSCFG